jgi:hypothetical protein
MDGWSAVSMPWPVQEIARGFWRNFYQPQIDLADFQRIPT